MADAWRDWPNLTRDTIREARRERRPRRSSAGCSAPTTPPATRAAQRPTRKKRQRPRGRPRSRRPAAALLSSGGLLFVSATTTASDTITATSDDRSLALILDGSRMLAEARDLFEINHVRSVAIAATAYARAQGSRRRCDPLRRRHRRPGDRRRIGEEVIAGQERGEIAKPGASVAGSRMSKAPTYGAPPCASSGSPATSPRSASAWRGTRAKCASTWPPPGSRPCSGALRAATKADRRRPPPGRPRRARGRRDRARGPRPGSARAPRARRRPVRRRSTPLALEEDENGVRLQPRDP